MLLLHPACRFTGYESNLGNAVLSAQHAEDAAAVIARAGISMVAAIAMMPVIANLFHRRRF